MNDRTRSELLEDLDKSMRLDVAVPDQYSHADLQKIAADALQELYSKYAAEKVFISYFKAEWSGKIGMIHTAVCPLGLSTLTSESCLAPFCCERDFQMPATQQHAAVCENFCTIPCIICSQRLCACRVVVPALQEY